MQSMTDAPCGKQRGIAVLSRSGTVGFPGGSKCFMSAFDFDVADHPRNGLARALSLSVAEGASRPLWPSEMLPNQVAKASRRPKPKARHLSHNKGIGIGHLDWMIFAICKGCAGCHL